MIQEFSVQNYLSFKNRDTISFLATSERKLKEELTFEPKKGVRLLRMALIYGPNASGKSNLLHAIEALWLLMFSPLDKEDDKIKLYNPFKLSDGEPTSCDATFWIGDKKYQYSIKYNETDILYEKLMYTSEGGVLSEVYERVQGEEIKFGSTIGIKSKQKNELIKETLRNHTILSTLNKKNIDVPDVISRLYTWIKTKVHELGIYSDPVDIVKQAEKDVSLKRLILDLLHRADFNITDFKVTETKLSENLISEIFKDAPLKEDLKENY